MAMRLIAFSGCQVRAIHKTCNVVGVHANLIAGLLNIIEGMNPRYTISASATALRDLIIHLTELLGVLRNVLETLQGDSIEILSAVKNAFQSFLNFSIDHVLPLIEKMEADLNPDAIEPLPPDRD